MKEQLTTIRTCIERIGARFSDNSALYFGESDLQSELFSLLLQELQPEATILNTSVYGTSKKPTVRDCNSRALHSELLLPEGRIDIAVLDLASATIAINSRGRFAYVRPGEGDHIFIEIKASRTNRSQISSKPAWIKAIRSDILKLSRYKHPCFVLCFDFSGILSNSEIEAFEHEASENVEVRYFTAPRGDRWFEKID